MIQSLVCLLLSLYLIILIGRIILSWVPSLPEPLLPVARFLSAVTDPLLLPLRNLLPPLRAGGMAIDLSPILLFIAINLLQGILCR